MIRGTNKLTSTHSWLDISSMMMFSVIYVLLVNQLSLLAIEKSHIAIFWLPGGIVLAFLLLKDLRAWPAVFVGALMAGLCISHGFWMSLCIALVNTLEAFCGAWLLIQYFPLTKDHDATETAQHFEAIIRSSRDAIISYTLDGRVTSWNPAAECIFQFSAHDIMDQPLTRLFPEAIVDEDRQILDRVRQGRMIQNWETLRLRQDGSVIPVSITISPIYDDQDNLIGASEIARDISQFKHQQAKLHQKNTQFRAAVETSIDGFLMFNEHGHILEVNDAYLKRSGYSRDELLGMTLSALEPQQRTGQTSAHRVMILQAGQDWFETTHHTKEGQIWPVEMAISRSPVAQNVFFSFIKDLTERKKWEKQLWHQANFDPLTNLPNRLFFYDRLSTTLSQAKRDEHSTGLIFLDLDGFKPVNDRYGHDAGDWALKTVAQRWSACIRKNDMIARLGGDEFAVIIAKLEHADEAVAVAKKLIESLETHILLPGNASCLLGTSAGIALFPTHATEIDTLLSAADTAMYASKTNGKNTYRMFSAGPNTQRLDNEWIKYADCQLIGIVELDEQHRQLVRLSNQLNQTIMDKAPNDRIRQLFDELLGYTAFHFETEHRIMKEYQYPNRVEHEQEHALLADELNSIARQAHHNLDELVLQKIRDWLFVDINRLDKHWALFIQQKTYENMSQGSEAEKP